MLYAFLILLADAKEKDPKAGEGPGPLLSLAPFILMIVVFYFLIILPGRRQRQQAQQMLGAVKKNDEVLTSAGIFGIVANIKDEEVTLKIDDNVRMRVLKSSIVRIVTPKESKEEPGKADTSQSVKADK